MSPVCRIFLVHFSALWKLGGSAIQRFGGRGWLNLSVSYLRRCLKNIPGYTGSVRYGGFWALFSLNGRQTECHNWLFLQNRNDQICVQLARSKSLATHASFTDYAGNGKQILKIMEDKENKRALNKCTDFHCTRIAWWQSEAAPWPSKWTAKWRKEEK